MKLSSIILLAMFFFWAQTTSIILAAESVNDKTCSLKPALGVNGKWGYRDNKNIFVIPPRFEYAGEFHNGIAVVGFINKKFGYIDMKGRMLFDALFDEARFFSEECAAVMIDMGGIKKWGYIDKKGVFCIFPQFDRVENFKSGRASIAIGNKQMVIDRQGKIVKTY